MMKTPIADFVQKYAESGSVRLHMPGHKGVPVMGCERLDITEISGADVLYSPSGIILESENNATSLFGSAHTFYSAEGSTLCIKAMLALLCQRSKDSRPLVLASRNVHKSFIYACALLDIDVEWIYPDMGGDICSCDVSARRLSDVLCGLERKPCAVYVTSPNYLGEVLDIRGVADVCHRHGVLLAVDNAHGAYLKFLDEKYQNRYVHPMDAGADICCDSAHKTLPVLTGGAYLHVSKSAPREFLSWARRCLSLFASTSPSYLILQSLDLCNRYISEGYAEDLRATCERLEVLKKRVSALGLSVLDGEPLKLTLDLSGRRGGGEGLCNYLSKKKIEMEFCDRRFAVMMFSAQSSQSDMDAVYEALCTYAHTADVISCENDVSTCEGTTVPRRAMSIRCAVLSEQEEICAAESIGRICASPTVSCPPAVPIVMSGEIICDEHIKLFQEYNISHISVVK